MALRVTAWYYQYRGQQMGPVSALEIRILVEAGQLAPETKVWHEGFANWRVASEIQELNGDDEQETPGTSLSATRSEFPKHASGQVDPQSLELQSDAAKLVPSSYRWDEGKLLRAVLGSFVFAALIVGNIWMSEGAGRLPGIVVSWLGGAFFGLICIAALLKLFSRELALAVSVDGIVLPSFSTEPIPWHAVKNLGRFQSRHVDVLRLELDTGVADSIRRRGFRGLLWLIMHASKGKATVNLKALSGNPDRIFNCCFEAWEHARGATATGGQEIATEDATEAEISLTPQILSYVLIGLLVAIYAGELILGVDPSQAGSPSIQTLFMLGATQQEALLQDHQWWRLFTAPLLHGSIVHLGFNCLALWFAGRLLERLIGWRWFAAIFFASALGGAIASVLFNAPNVVGVGASGGIVGLFAAIMVASFRGHLAPLASALRIGAAQMLVPALIPFLSSAKDGQMIDYAGHFGGVVAGGAAALVLLIAWPRERSTPRFGSAAVAFSSLFVIVATASLLPITRLREEMLADPFWQFFTGRYDDAAASFLSKAETNGKPAPYYRLWRYLAQERGGDDKAAYDLQSAAAKLEPTRWPHPIYDLFLGKLSPEEVAAKAGNGDELCEAIFYAGEWYLQRGKVAEANRRFQGAVWSCPKTFMEYDGAVGELRLLAASAQETKNAAQSSLSEKNAPKADQTAQNSEADRRPPSSPNPDVRSPSHLKAPDVKTERKPDGSTIQTQFDYRARKIQETEVTVDGRTIETTFEASIGRPRSIERKNKDGRRISATLLDPLNTEPWTRVEQRYGPSDIRSFEMQFKDDGTKVGVAFDVFGAQRKVDYYNKASELTRIVEFDPDNTRPWSTITTEVDGEGRVLAKVTVMNDGSKNQVNHDLEGKGKWTRYEQAFDAGGQLRSVAQENDDGTSNYVTFDISNIQDWSKLEQFRNRAGQLENQTMFSDTGAKIVTSYDAGGNSSWEIYVQHYDAAGSLQYVDQTNDDRSHYSITYDVENNQPWERYEQVATSSGEIASQTNFNDGGTRDYIVFDTTGDFPWVSKSDSYDLSGKLIATHLIDDGGGRRTLSY
ncbi:Membrane associated serine protease, rhomboid family [Rhizobium tibeticum]|uniref:Membrane associated serine protease, rhomboid family n=1 Tax=Rhizobium tibeticum TaxID=501024 RepID=A0A1H8TWI9_9HYPH|nr:rhomboid family intramembrane serine protease [Rhizobium tibeticum]SEI15687.1 Rhomboid protease GluP [Rhizobium tibeticum]SEO94954.1 Membrane associated serine protease, rhomboid family [Rhizobium tibeticum]